MKEETFLSEPFSAQCDHIFPQLLGLDGTLVMLKKNDTMPAKYECKLRTCILFYLILHEHIFMLIFHEYIFITNSKFF